MRKRKGTQNKPWIRLVHCHCQQTFLEKSGFEAVEGVQEMYTLIMFVEVISFYLGLSMILQECMFAYATMHSCSILFWDGIYIYIYILSQTEMANGTE